VPLQVTFARPVGQVGRVPGMSDLAGVVRPCPARILAVARRWCTGPPGSACGSPRRSGGGASACWPRRVMCGRARWTWPGGGGRPAARRWRATRTCTGNWPQPGRGRSESSMASARRAPRPGQKGSRRWRQTRARQRQQEAARRRRVTRAHHEAAAAVIAWSVASRVGTLKVGDPRGVLDLAAGRRHNKRVRDWRIGHLLRTLRDKAAQAGITAVLVDERGTSSTCPSCARRVPKPSGRTFSCPSCGFTGHRDLVGGANIATRTPGGGPLQAGNPFPVWITHRRAGNHLPGVSPARRDPRRRSHHGGTRGSPGRPRPAPPGSGDVARLPHAAGREDRLTAPGQPGKR
jgi:hypothetical protein